MNYPVEVEKLQAKSTTVKRKDGKINHTEKEGVMSTRFFFKVILALGLLAMILVVAQTLAKTTVLAPARAEARTALSAVSSDWIERHPQAAVRADVYGGSDYFERHAPVLARVNYIGSDWIERHPSFVTSKAAYVGSDWIERHPPAVARIAAHANSDYFERHPLMFLSTASYAGSDYAERHPSNRFAGSDFSERHPDVLVNP
jgi:hypothetical protein